jgi:hypothetical protein
VFIAKVAYSEHLKSVVTDRLLRLFYHRKDFSIDRYAVLDPRTQAGLCRLIRRWEVAFSRKESDLGFGESSCPQWGQHLEVSRRLRTGAKLKRVIGIFSIGERREMLNLSSPTRGPNRPSRTLAMMTAIRRSVLIVAGLMRRTLEVEHMLKSRE